MQCSMQDLSSQMQGSNSGLQQGKCQVLTTEPPGNSLSWYFWICYCCLVAKLCPTLLQHLGLLPASLLCSWDFPGKNTGLGCYFLLQGIFPAQGSNLCFLHCRQILNSWSTREDPLLNIPLGTIMRALLLEGHPWHPERQTNKAGTWLIRSDSCKSHMDREGTG